MTEQRHNLAVDIFYKIEYQCALKVYHPARGIVGERLAQTVREKLTIFERQRWFDWRQKYFYEEE